MKKLLQILAVGVVAMMPLAFTNSASALGTCEIGFTGPDSNNQCISKTEYECTIINNTAIEVTNENFQVAVSGDATGSDNNESGIVRSGSSVNDNGLTFNATVTSDGDGEICAVVAVVPATNPPVVTPGAGSAQPEVVPAPVGGGGGAAGVAVLPETSSDMTMTYLASLVGILGLGTLVARGAVLAYSQLRS
jgi:hypothetical protein